MFFTIAKNYTKMPNTRRIDKEVVVYMHTGILLSYEKRWNFEVDCNIDGIGVYHAKCSESEEKDKYQVILLVNGI